MHTAQGVPEHFSASDMRDVAPVYIAPLVVAERADDFISPESSPGHIDGGDVFYH